MKTTASGGQVAHHHQIVYRYKSSVLVKKWQLPVTNIKIAKDMALNSFVVEKLVKKGLLGDTWENCMEELRRME